jgi:hypothetical protein
MYQSSCVRKLETLSPLAETGWVGTLTAVIWERRCVAAEERLCRTEEERRALGAEESCSAQDAKDELSAAVMSA